MLEIPVTQPSQNELLLETAVTQPSQNLGLLEMSVKQFYELSLVLETPVKQFYKISLVLETPVTQIVKLDHVFENKEKDMKKEHKTLKWCAVLLALIVAIAAVTLTALQTVPADAPVTVEIEGGGQPAVAVLNEEPETAAIKAMPEEMAGLTTDHNVEVLADSAAQQEDAQVLADSAAQQEDAQVLAEDPAQHENVQSAGDSDSQAVSDTDGATPEGQAEVDTGAQIDSADLKPVNVTVKVDGMEMHLMAAPVTVKQILEGYGIPVGTDDIVKPAMDQQLTDDTEITVQRIVFEEVVVSEEVPFKTKVKGTDELPAKTQKVVQKGQKGEDKVTYKVTYADGKEIARKEVDRERVKKPVTKIIHKSTVGTINGKEYSRKFTVKAYSYTGGGTTASGLPAAVGRIAVDPGVIPLGTQVYVEGYGFATAADTGGNIKGNTIDVYYNSESQCRQWGCRYITIYILK